MAFLPVAGGIMLFIVIAAIMHLPILEKPVERLKLKET